METYLVRISRLLFILLSLSLPAAMADNTPVSKDASQLLQWIQDPHSQNICSGYYREAKLLLDYPSAAPLGETEVSTKAKFSSLSLNQNAGELVGDVEVIQQGRYLKANKATVYYNADTGDITRIVFNGRVSLREAGKFIASEQATLYPQEKRVLLQNATYRVTDQTQNQGLLNIWGTSVGAERESSGILHFTQATYTTCSPADRVWQVEGSDVKIDKKAGWASVKDAKLRLGSVPIFYFPYLTFPIDNARKTGFLLPIYGYSNNGGLDLSFPFYWNIAPNYDATITPRAISKRGVETSALFRYLTSNSTGNVSVSYMPNDSVFADFKQTAPSAYAGAPNAAPYLNELAHDNDSRYGFSLMNATTFNEHWSTTLNLNYVSDSYYFLDLGNDFNALNQDQLLNDLDINYQDVHWNFLGRLQAYETLHAITQPFIMDQYTRTPEFDLNGYYPSQAYGLDYQLLSQFVRFDHAKDFLTGIPVITGNRWHFQPQVSLPLHFQNNGFITPAIAVDASYYTLQNFGTTFPGTVDRVLPIVSLNSGLFFQRMITFNKSDYTQTLEPKVYYLYVPNQNQDNIPIFDTTLPPFTFAQLFSNNRFAGYDRFGDANQITFALTSRFLSADSGEQKLQLSIGEIYYIQKPQVCLNPGCIDDPTINDNVSPVIGEASYNLTRNWSATATIAYDAEQVRINNTDLNIHYESDKGHIFNIGYDFVRDGEQLANPLQFTVPNGSVLPNGSVISNGTISPNGEVNTNLDQFSTSMAWPLPFTDHISAVGEWEYSFSNGRTQAAIAGLQYNSCCWAVRLVTSHIYIGQNSLGNNQFDTAYYLQFSFKGFTNVGNADPSSLLQNAIEGYQDYF